MFLPEAEMPSAERSTLQVTQHCELAAMIGRGRRQVQLAVAPPYTFVSECAVIITSNGDGRSQAVS
jgi:hypothetical protein